MQNRWAVLVVLFTVRVAMGFQLQSVPALSPLFLQDYGVDLTSLGILIALYLLPGIVIAFPGGAIGARFGDRRAITAGLVLMVLGGAIMAGVPGWPAQIAGRLIAGVGGILLNVLMTKMVTDHFAGREIATALGIFINSWPVGIAFALMILPPVATAGGLHAALWLTTGAAMAALLLFVTAAPRNAARDGGNPHLGIRLRGAELAAVIVAACIWGAYNAAAAMVFSFGPALLSERGWSASAAASATSLTMWAVVVSVPIGGLIADRTGRNVPVIVAGCIGFALSLSLVAENNWGWAAFILLGLIGGAAGGPIMSLPSRVLAPAHRAVGMGTFYTVFYIFMFGAPVIAGALSDAAGSTAAAFHFGAALLVASVLMLPLFARFAIRAASA